MILKIYKDEKQLTLRVLERIQETKDIKYMLVDYDGYNGDDFNGVDEEYLTSEYHRITDFLFKNYSDKKIDAIEINKIKIRILLSLENIYKSFIVAKDFLNNIEIEQHIKDLFYSIKMPILDDANKQLELIGKRINNLESKTRLLVEQIKNKNKESQENEEDELSILDIIASVEMCNEQPIDIDKTSIYMFKVKQKMAEMKIKQINNRNKKS